MKTTLLGIILFSVCFVQAQQLSERRIVSKFEDSVKELSLFADSAKTVQDCAEISSLIDVVEQQNLEHKDLLDQALYPDDFRKTMEKIRGKLMIRRNDLGVIEAQYERISDLEIQVLGLSSKVDSLSLVNEKLLSDIKRMSFTAATNKAHVDSLRTVINKLRQNLNERDQAIFSLVDSLFLQYDKNIADMSNIEKQSIYGKIERRNIFSSIKKSIDDNLKFLQSTTLTPGDYVEITRQHSRFTSQWKGVGPKLAGIYMSGKKKNDEVQLIDSMLAVWSKEVDRSSWSSLNTLLNEHGIALKPFSNGNEFTSNFTEHVDGYIKNTAQEPDDVQAKRYNTFNDAVWKNNLQPIWLPVLVESGKLTADQKDKIEEAVDNWHSAVTPAPIALYVLILVVLALIVGGLVMRFKKKPEPEA